MKTPKVLIASAWWPEQSLLATSLRAPGSDDAWPVKGEPTLSEDGHIAFLLTGIGSVEAALATLKTLLQFPSIEEVHFCGTAGAYNPQSPLNTAHQVTQCLWGDAALALQLSYLPEGTHCGFKETVSSLQPTVESLRCLCLPSITTDERAVQALSGIGELENLELYGVASAANQLGKSWSGFLGVSNWVGPNAHEQWKKNQKEASRSAQDLLKKTLNLF